MKEQSYIPFPFGTENRPYFQKKRRKKMCDLHDLYEGMIKEQLEAIKELNEIMREVDNEK